jgi:hypothetical protein
MKRIVLPSMMLAATLGFGVVGNSSEALAHDKTVVVKFAAGTSGRAYNGTIKGRDAVNYIMDVGQGQMVHVLFTADHPACYFNFYSPGDGQSAIHRGEIEGNEFSARMVRSGSSRVQIYMMRSAARRNETCKFSLSLEATV